MSVDDYWAMTTLWNCPKALKKCPMEWSRLDETGTDGIRHCKSCDRDVHYCETPEQFVELGNAGKCVAIPQSFDCMEMMMLGRPSNEAIEALERKNTERKKWWIEALALKPAFSEKAFHQVRACLNSRESKPS